MGKIVPVILCGGSGTRLWPRSRATSPKPFIPLLGDRTLYQATLERTADRSVFAAPIVVVGEKHLPFAKPQAADIATDTRFIVEPMGRNTGPAIALAWPVTATRPTCLRAASSFAFIDAAWASSRLQRDISRRRSRSALSCKPPIPRKYARLALCPRVANICQRTN